MLAALLRVGLARPRLVAVAALILLAYAVLAIRAASFDTFPRLAPAEATVETEAPGLVAEQVEALVTRPVENALISARGVARVRSRSIQGLSVVTLQFLEGSDADRVRSALAERLVQAAGELPAGVGSPHLTPLISGEGPFWTVGFTSDGLKPMALRNLVQWTLRPRLLSAPGVGEVQVFGGEVRRIEVRARAGDLSDSDLGYGDVYDAVRRSTGVTGSGFIDTPTQRVQIEPHGQALTPEDVAAGQIQVVGSAPVRISDVADVVEAPAPQIGDALVMGRPGVVVRLFARYGADNQQAREAAGRALAALRPALERQGVRIWGNLKPSSDGVRDGIAGLLGEMLIGLGAAVVLLTLFLRDWRAALVCIFSIAASLLVAALAVAALGWTFNTMTLGGLAVAVGLVVDDAVIDVEAVLTALRRADRRHGSPDAAILEASLSVREPVVLVTLMVVAALLPVVFLGGLQGAMLRPLALSVIIAALASLAVAFLVTPALARLFLTHIRPGEEPGVMRRLRAGYDGLLIRVERTPRAGGLLAVGALVVVMLLALGLKFEVLPGFHVGRLTAEIAGPPSTSMAAMGDLARRISMDLSRDPDVRSVFAEIGRAEQDEDAGGPEHALFDLQLAPGLSISAQRRAERRLQARIGAYPGLGPEVRSSVGGGELTGTERRAVEARIYGQDLGAIEGAARGLERALRARRDVRAVTSSLPARAPVIRVDLNFQRLAIYGLSALDVLNAVQTAFQGRPAAELFENGRAIEIAVTAQADFRQEPERAGELLLRSSSGVSVPLKTVANVYLSDGPVRIDHEGGLRGARVAARLAANDEGEIRKVEAALAGEVPPAPGAYVEFETPETRFDPNHSLGLNSLLAVAAILALLGVGFGELRTCVAVLASTLPALGGGVLAVWLSGGILSIGALTGFFTLFGLSARSAALLISRVEELAGEDRVWSRHLLRRAAHDRFAPMAMSALIVAAALAPLAVRADAPGHEILGPLASVVLAGLLVGTVTGLILLPSLLYGLRPLASAPPSGARGSDGGEASSRQPPPSA